MISLRLQRFLLLVFGMASLASCARDDAPESVTAPLHPIPESIAGDAAVAYANRVTRTGFAYREGFFEHEGMRAHYVEAGEGDLVILFHGFPSFWFSFFDQMEALKLHYRVVAVDGLGAGLSDKPGGRALYTVEVLAAQLDAVACN